MDWKLQQYVKFWSMSDRTREMSSKYNLFANPIIKIFIIQSIGNINSIILNKVFIQVCYYEASRVIEYFKCFNMYLGHKT